MKTLVCRFCGVRQQDTAARACTGLNPVSEAKLGLRWFTVRFHVARGATCVPESKPTCRHAAGCLMRGQSLELESDLFSNDAGLMLAGACSAASFVGHSLN